MAPAAARAAAHPHAAAEPSLTAEALEHRNVAQLREAAERAGIRVELRAFVRTTRTARDAAREIGCELAQIVKSLVFLADGQAVIALCGGEDRIDEEALRRHLGVSSVRRASAEEARAATGYPVGGTPPFGHRLPLRVVIDPGLLRHEVVWAGAGLPEAVMGLGPADLLRGSGGRVVPIAERALRANV